MNTQDNTLARKYAKAFINVFIDKLDTQEMEHVKRLATFLGQHRRVLFYVQLSFLDGETTKKDFLDLLIKFNLDSLFKSLINLLEQQQRLFLLPKILEYIVRLYNEQHGIMEFTIVSSHRLNEPELNQIVDFLSEKTGKKILYTALIDKRLIAGIKLYSDSYGWEHSVRKQLKALRAAP